MNEDFCTNLKCCNLFKNVVFQVNNLNKRFENLDTLKSNNWEEIMPEQKVVKKVQPVKKVNAKASSKLKDAIKGR